MKYAGTSTASCLARRDDGKVAAGGAHDDEVQPARDTVPSGAVVNIYPRVDMKLGVSCPFESAAACIPVN